MEGCSVKRAQELEAENHELRALVTTERVRCQERDDRIKVLEAKLSRKPKKKLFGR